MRTDAFVRFSLYNTRTLFLKANSITLTSVHFGRRGRAALHVPHRRPVPQHGPRERLQQPPHQQHRRDRGRTRPRPARAVAAQAHSGGARFFILLSIL